LSDKTDEHVEKAHQYWENHQARYCRIPNFQQREMAIRKSERKSRHPRVSFETEEIIRKKRKQSTASSRKRTSEEKKLEEKQAKEEKRQRYR
jgi:hypothetical protein